MYYHILIDPWLRGGQSDVARFFSQQWHKEESAVQTIGEVEDAIKGIDEVAQSQDVEDTMVVDTDPAANDSGEAEAEGSYIDAVIISHEFTDHMHKETLLEISATVPIFATAKAFSAIRSWRHFSSIHEIPRFNTDWRLSSVAPLPEWVSVSRVAYPGADLLYYHSAIMVAFSSGNGNGGDTEGEGEEAEAVIYTPHGISPNDIAPVSEADPKIKTLALLHGLQDISLGAQLNMGAHNGLKVQRLLEAKYWVGTHDEIKRGGGIVSWFLERKMVSLKEAIEKEKEERGSELKGSALEGLSEVRFEELGNGASLILE